jgi:hypothetical protein
MKKPSLFLASALSVAALFTLPACSPSASLPEAPDAAMQKITKDLGEGKAGVLWTAMPVSYQQDVTALAHEAGAKVDAELYDRGFALVDKLADVLGRQRAFILGSPMAAQVQDKAALEANWDAGVAMVRAVTKSKLSTAAGLRTLDVKAFLETSGSELLAHAQKLGGGADEPSLFQQLKAVKFEVENRDATAAALRVTQPDGTVTTVQLVKVEERWVPADLAAEWSARIAQARADLAATQPEDMAKNKPQVLGAFAMAEGVLAQLGAAQTQEQFDQALQNAMMPLMGLMMMGQGLNLPGVR